MDCYGSGGCHKKVGVRSLDFLYYRKMLSTKKVDLSLLPDLAWYGFGMACMAHFLIPFPGYITLYL